MSSGLPIREEERARSRKTSGHGFFPPPGFRCSVVADGLGLSVPRQLKVGQWDRLRPQCHPGASISELIRKRFTRAVKDIPVGKGQRNVVGEPPDNSSCCGVTYARRPCVHMPSAEGKSLAWRSCNPRGRRRGDGRLQGVCLQCHGFLLQRARKACSVANCRPCFSSRSHRTSADIHSGFLTSSERPACFTSEPADFVFTNEEGGRAGETTAATPSRAGAAHVYQVGTSMAPAQRKTPSWHSWRLPASTVGPPGEEFSRHRID
jgi:hypothetical protein